MKEAKVYRTALEQCTGNKGAGIIVNYRLYSIVACNESQENETVQGHQQEAGYQSCKEAEWWKEQAARIDRRLQ
jgi:hypothetical protein